jgi:hypothetical protein
MSKSFERGLLVLRMIPHYPRHITTKEIAKRLADEYRIAVNIRTIQHDLLHISNVYPLQRADHEFPPRYYWPQGSQVELVPGHDDYSALAWHLLAQYLEPLLPKVMSRQAQPHFEAARRYLNRDDRTQIKGWAERVRLVAENSSSQSQAIDDTVRTIIYDCLWEGEAVSVDYLHPDVHALKTLTLHPQGVVIIGKTVFLIATIDGEDILEQFALHRIQKAESTYRPIVWIADFDLDACIQNMNLSH